MHVQDLRGIAPTTRAEKLLISELPYDDIPIKIPCQYTRLLTAQLLRISLLVMQLVYNDLLLAAFVCSLKR